jgi:putative ABC transport system permease protein
MLLLAYPAEFRDEFGEEMERVAAKRMQSEPRLLLWLSLMADVAVTAPREHFQILTRDVKHSVRLLANAPGFTATALLALALGVGASVIIFSLIDAVLLRSLPFGAPERLVYIWSPLPRYEPVARELGPSYPDVVAFREMSHSFTDITAVRQRMLTVNAGQGPMRVGVAIVLGNFFHTIQVAPLMGRTIEPADDQPGQAPVAVISYDLWRSQWNLDPAVLERTVRLGAEAYRIVGVMPAGFGYPHENDYPNAMATLKRTDIWIPAQRTPQQMANRMSTADAAVGRLRPGMTLLRSQSEMTAIAKQLDSRNVLEMRGTESLLVPLLDTAMGPVRPLMRLLAGAVLLVLLIACGNVANLLMARAAGRGHEMGVRTALGAPRARLIRQLLTESLLLSITGGALGALLSVAALKILTRLNPGDIPRFEQASIDGSVLFFALAISVATGLLFGILPALTASRVDVSDLLRQGGRGRAGGSSRTRYALIVADVALATVLLAGAGLFIRSYLAVQGEDKGFSPSTLTMKLAPERQARTAEQAITRGRGLIEQLAALPGVVAVGGTNAIPLSHSESVSTLRVEGYPNRRDQTVDIRDAAGRLFEAMQIRLIAGRYLTPADAPASGPPAAVVVNESFVHQYFRGREALGGHVLRPPNTKWSTVVGIVADVRHSSLEKSAQPTLYEPSWNVDSLAIRADVPPERLIAAVRSAVHEVDPTTALSDIQTMRQRTSDATARRTFQTLLLVSFAAIAVFLALVGLYGLLSYAVRQRSGEIGIRMAMGASRGAVVSMIVRQGLLLTVAGLTLGLGVAVAVALWGATLLYGVRAFDPVTFVAAPIFMLIAAAIACFLPAWKAARIDPATCLRQE